MFSSAPNYNKLKTNLRLACNRLKLLEKKKTETNQKARKEIAGIFCAFSKLLLHFDNALVILLFLLFTILPDFISIGKPDRARIRVESIIREDVRQFLNSNSLLLFTK